MSTRRVLAVVASLALAGCARGDVHMTLNIIGRLALSGIVHHDVHIALAGAPRLIDAKDWHRHSLSGHETPKPQIQIPVTILAGTKRDLYRTSFMPGEDASICKNGEYDPLKPLPDEVLNYDATGMVDPYAIVQLDTTPSLKPHNLQLVYLDPKSRVDPHDNDVIYDLQRDPQDVCIRLKGFSLGVFEGELVTNTIVISKTMLIDAFKAAAP